MHESSNNVLPPITSSPKVDNLANNIITTIPKGVEEMVGPTSKDVMIGAGALLVLTIVFFFIRMSFVNYLTGSMKRSPNNAGLAGWGLFGGMFFGAALGCTALVSKIYMTMPLIIPLSALSLFCFIMAIMVASKK